jgi:dTDP-4-dehydrorhamnose reductase
VVGKDNVIAAYISDKKVNLTSRYEQLDVTDFKRYDEIVAEHKLDYIVHLDAILFALGDHFPDAQPTLTCTAVSML